jgi:glycosyltransferase involved in cell wall biosynthesis
MTLTAQNVSAGEAAPAVELTILMPCLNEAETLECCINKARRFLANNPIAGEIIVADNGSTDGSREIAARLGARVIHVTDKGYGSALMGGIRAAKGKFIIMGDADDSYDFSRLMPFVEKLRDGYDCHGKSLPRRDQTGRDATASSLSGKSRFERTRTVVFSFAGRRFPLRLARFHQGGDYEFESDYHRNGVRQRDGGQSVAVGSAHRRSANDTFAGRPEPPASFAELARRLAALAFHAPLQSPLAFFLSGADPDVSWIFRRRLAAAQSTPGWHCDFRRTRSSMRRWRSSSVFRQSCSRSSPRSSRSPKGFFRKTRD